MYVLTNNSDIAQQEGRKKRTAKCLCVTKVTRLLLAWLLLYCVVVFFKKICLKENEVWWKFFETFLLSCLSPKQTCQPPRGKKLEVGSKKPWDWAKKLETSPNLIIQSIRMWRLTISTPGLYFTLYFADPSYFLVLPALRCRFGLDSSELSAELESSLICNTVSNSRWKPAIACEILLHRKAFQGTAS